MRKIILKSVEGIVYTGQYIEESNGKINIANVESDNVQENALLQKAKDINTGMIFLRENIVWYTFK